MSIGVEDVLALFIGCLLDNIMSVINALSECGHVVCVCVINTSYVIHSRQGNRGQRVIVSHKVTQHAKQSHTTRNHN